MRSLLSRLVAWANQRLIDDKRKIHLMWSVRIQLFWVIVSGAYMALPAFQEYVSAFWFALLCVGFGVSIFFARITKQFKD